MDLAFTVLGLGAVDAVLTGVLKEAKQANKVMFVRISMYLVTALMSLKEVVALFEHVRSVFGL